MFFSLKSVHQPKWCQPWDDGNAFIVLWQYWAAYRTVQGADHSQVIFQWLLSLLTSTETQILGVSEIHATFTQVKTIGCKVNETLRFTLFMLHSLCSVAPTAWGTQRFSSLLSSLSLHCVSHEILWPKASQAMHRRTAWTKQSKVQETAHNVRDSYGFDNFWLTRWYTWNPLKCESWLDLAAAGLPHFS